MRTLDEYWQSGSPYMACYSIGLAGYPLKEVISFFRSHGVELRDKDIQNWENGWFKHQGTRQFSLMPDKSNDKVGLSVVDNGRNFNQFPRFPEGWTGCEKRYFPCTSDNRPMCRWGWTNDYIPQLYTLPGAKALSPVGWVGQNMLYQRFVVMDIDGAGHGESDPYVIAFGNLYKDRTLSYEDPAKPGSFHLYFSTDRIIPTMHFGWAKLDFMGNANNYAVYLKNKQSNGMPMMELDEQVWNAMLDYQAYRKSQL